MPKFRSTQVLIALVISLLTLIPSARAEESIVHFGTFSKAVDYAPYLVAKQKHLFDDALKKFNAKATYEEFQSLPAINEAFASNRLDFVYEAESPCLVGKAAGIDLKIVGVSAFVDVPVLVHKDAHITDLSQLRGKKIAVLAGTSAHYVLLKLLEKANLTKNDVSILNMTPPDAKSAFDSNKIDAWSVWPPFVEQEELSGIGVTLPKASGRILVVMVARGGFVKEKPEITKAVRDVLANARAWVSTHPEEAQKIVTAEWKIPLPVVQRAWARQDWKAGIDKAALQDIQDKADFLKSVGFVRHNVDAKSLVLKPSSD
jgi:sulfonate transport system substrate-binding protein